MTWNPDASLASLADAYTQAALADAVTRALPARQRYTRKDLTRMLLALHTSATEVAAANPGTLAERADAWRAARGILADPHASKDSRVAAIATITAVALIDDQLGYPATGDDDSAPDAT